MIPHLAQSDVVTASYSTFWHFWTFFGHFGGSKGAPGGVSGGGWKKIFSLKDALYLDNSNDTSFSSIGHRDGKLFNFLTFLDIFWTFFGQFGGQNGPPGGWGGWGEKILFAKSCLLIALKILFEYCIVVITSQNEMNYCSLTSTSLLIWMCTRC